MLKYEDAGNFGILYLWSAFYGARASRPQLTLDMIEIDNFYNDGFGWVCKNCERELAEIKVKPDTNLNRIMREGEAESKQPRLSNSALARWADKARLTLICPRCHVVEKVDKA
jgi:hypothetical protein